MVKGIFWPDGLDLQLYGFDVLHYWFDGASLVEECLYEFIYSQNLYLGSDLNMHRYV